MAITGGGRSFIQLRAVDRDTPQRSASEARLASARLGSSRICSSAWARPMRRMAVTVTTYPPKHESIDCNLFGVSHQRCALLKAMWTGCADHLLEDKMVTWAGIEPVW